MLDLKAVGFDVVVVFDGQRPLAKMANEKRLHDRFARIDNYFDADAKGNARVASKLLRELVVPTDAMLDRVKTAFTNNNIRHKTAPFEAEKQIAYDVCQVSVSEHHRRAS